MPELLQDALVTVLALGAAVLVVRRVLGVVGSSARGGACDACPSGQAHRAGAGPAEGAHPLTLVRNRRS